MNDIGDSERDNKWKGKNRESSVERKDCRQRKENEGIRKVGSWREKPQSEDVKV